MGKILINGGIVALHDSRDSTNKSFLKRMGMNIIKAPDELLNKKSLAQKDSKI